MTDEGVKRITLRKYQRKILKAFQHNRFNALLASRQIGKSAMAAIFIAWYLCFHYDRNVLVVSNKFQSTNEIITKVKQVLYNLPFYMKPGTRNIGITGLSLDNGCRVISSATTPTAGIGFANHLVYADEFAYVPDTIANQFYKSIFPTLVSSKISRMIITSTANGKNLFYKIYMGGLNKENDFNSMRVDWWEVPGRDEEWKRKEIANLGSVEIFEQEYGNSFDVAQNLLADSTTMKLFDRIKTDFVHKQIDLLESDYYDYDKLVWHPKLFDGLTDEDKFVLSIDIGSGVGGDYTVVNIFKIFKFNSHKIRKYNLLPKNEDDFFGLVEVGKFRDNFTSNDEVAYLVSDLIMDFLLPDNTLVVIELNHRGEEFKKDMERFRPDLIDHEVFFKGYTKNIGKRVIYKPGIFVTKDRVDDCKKLKKYWLNKKIICTSNTGYKEISAFKLSSKNRFEGIGEHDDEVMTQLNVGKVFNTTQFSYLVESEIDKFTDIEYELIQEKIEQFTD
jgi:hypothetical protein